jgi:hypothetical protein
MVKSIYFEGFIMIAIFLNTITMSIKYESMSDDFDNFLIQSNTIFTIIFNIEAFLKLIAMGKIYFREGWNIFDFIVVCITDIGLIVSLLGKAAGITTAVTVIRAFRILRIFRLIKSAENIKIILDTLVNIIP